MLQQSSLTASWLARQDGQNGERTTEERQNEDSNPDKRPGAHGTSEAAVGSAARQDDGNTLQA